MIENIVTVYISDNCAYCDKLIKTLNNWGIVFEQRNVSLNRDYMKELQEVGIYGTPVTYIRSTGQYILGLQINVMKKALAIE
ncbi:thioredoxin reductase (NADPH) [Oceanobacillus limi]|uniref:Thioredoxin reductase (NADPH) n=1 Tax=Oceanobacillus limi TaxID=930131 RepID=A0A1I0H7S0_9BACI|nr:glutaredoxin family protein [Oceanobacillus limi]SET79806.1 thioredoxin reductase (NADPH) [Oceanobacillus limi]